ncbi:hypothetical protein V1264_007163 [Littorina saxatilis]|uniref:Uncharacterized protein n=1 Tax=Littorina saxatilis TaxID=31220 RepID=A0AAN9AVL8_9CAEN
MRSYSPCIHFRCHGAKTTAERLNRDRGLEWSRTPNTGRSEALTDEPHGLTTPLESFPLLTSSILPT